MNFQNIWNFPPRKKKCPHLSSWRNQQLKCVQWVAVRLAHLPILLPWPGASVPSKGWELLHRQSQNLQTKVPFRLPKKSVQKENFTKWKNKKLFQKDKRWQRLWLRLTWCQPLTSWNLRVQCSSHLFHPSPTTCSRQPHPLPCSSTRNSKVCTRPCTRSTLTPPSFPDTILHVMDVFTESAKQCNPTTCSSKIHSEKWPLEYMLLWLIDVLMC